MSQVHVRRLEQPTRASYSRSTSTVCIGDSSVPYVAMAAAQLDAVVAVAIRAYATGAHITHFEGRVFVNQSHRHRRKCLYRRRCVTRRCALALDDQCRRSEWRVVCGIDYYCFGGFRDTARGDPLCRPLVPPRKAALLHVSCDESLLTSLRLIIVMLHLVVALSSAHSALRIY